MINFIKTLTVTEVLLGLTFGFVGGGLVVVAFTAMEALIK